MADEPHGGPSEGSRTGIPASLRQIEFAEPLWFSESIGLVVVDRMGAVLAANPMIREMVGNMVGSHLDEFTPPDHRRAVMIAAATAGDGWTTLGVGFAPDERGVPRDVVFWLHALSESEVVILVEPAYTAQGEVIEHLAGMVEDLLGGRGDDPVNL